MPLVKEQISYAKLAPLVASAWRADDYFCLLQTVAALDRTSCNLHTLQHAREMLPMIGSNVARDAASDLDRAFELLHSDAKNGLNYIVAQRSEQQSQRSYEMAVSAHRLNLLVST